MRFIVERQTVRQILKWTQRGLAGAAVVMFAYCGFVLSDTWRFQKKESHQLERIQPELMQPVAATPVSDGLMGRIEIPRLGLSVMVMEGDDETTLRHAVGHISGTTFPGRPGNIGLAGHRDTFFRPLRNIKHDDLITLTTPTGEFRYRVISTTIVKPSAVWVLNPGPQEVLTLVTCYPFYFVGSAPNRFIVRAERVT
jgi:sortase A